MSEPWLRTAGGRNFPLLNPSPQDVDIRDIAHALGKLIRFTGHVDRPWTVAEHSVLVALILREQGWPADVQFAGLLHDAAEAYTGDVSTPMKVAMKMVAPSASSAFVLVESRIRGAIEQRFNIRMAGIEKIVKGADLIAGATEARDLLPDGQDLFLFTPESERYGMHVEVAMTYAWHLYCWRKLDETLEGIPSPRDLFLGVFASLRRDVYKVTGAA